MAEDENDRPLRVALWNSGIALNMAWYKFGAERQRKQQIERRGTPASMVIQRLMMGDVFGDLASGQLAAYGFRLAPTISDGPILIPADTFQTPLSDDWEEDKVSASGYSYDRVTVLSAETVSEGSTGAHSTQQGAPSSHSAEETNDSARPQSKRRGGGRTSRYEEARNVLHALNKIDPSNLRLSAANLVDKFNEHLFELYPALKGNMAPVSPRALQNHLKAFKLEVTGNN